MPNRLLKLHLKWEELQKTKYVSFSLVRSSCKLSILTWNVCFDTELNINIRFSGFVERRNVENYKLHRDKFVKKGQKNVNFRSAVAQMDDFISDPQVLLNRRLW